MQKVVMVRGSLDGTGGWARSFEVDACSERPDAPLRELLAKGWRVSRACPMPSELESCCLLVLDEPAADELPPEFVPAAESITHGGAITTRCFENAIMTSDADDLPLSLFGIEQ